MTKRVESLRAPCLDASSTLATSTSKKTVSAVFFFVSVARSFSRWRFGWLIYGRLMFATANLCFCRWLSLKINFQISIHQKQQSSIASTSLRSPLNCGGRSTLHHYLCKNSHYWVILCFLQMAIFENKLSDIHPQNQQSSIASTSLRSPLNCGGQSTIYFVYLTTTPIFHFSFLISNF